MPYIDFSAIKETVKIEDAARWLDLKLQQANAQFRSPCPACRDGGDRAVVITPAKGLFYCFPSKEGGDCIKLVAHIRGVDQKAAATLLQEQFCTPARTVQNPSEPSAPPTATVSGFKALDYLEADHMAVDAIGFDEDTAKALGIGFAPRGMMKGRVAIPLRLEDGTLAGYIGITEAKLPSKWHLTSNVVPFQKKIA